MAGNYPDPPGARMSYDRDGSQMAYVDQVGTVKQYSAAQMRLVNSETAADFVSEHRVSNAPGVGNSYLAVVFPEARDLKGYFANVAYRFNWPSMGTGTEPRKMQASTDSTNGMDGTWSDLPFEVRGEPSLTPYYRSNIVPVSVAGVRAVRMEVYNSNATNLYAGRDYRALHLYGAPAEATDRLELWHPTLDEPLSKYPAWLDWGNRPRGSTEVKQFRVKNLSLALSASNITVGMEALTDPTPSYVAMHKFSYQGSADAATATIPILAPTQMSEVITIRQTLDPSAVIGVWAQRITAIAGVWA